MANDLITVGNPFLRAAEQLRSKGRIDRTTIIDQPAKVVGRSPRKAMLNFIPDADTLSTMIDRALQAISRGIRWDRGSILNLVI